jgi:hypothetical protein
VRRTRRAAPAILPRPRPPGRTAPLTGATERGCAAPLGVSAFPARASPVAGVPGIRPPVREDAAGAALPPNASALHGPLRGRYLRAARRTLTRRAALVFPRALPCSGPNESAAWPTGGVGAGGVGETLRPGRDPPPGARPSVRRPAWAHRPHRHHAPHAGLIQGSTWVSRVAGCPHRHTLTPIGGKRGAKWHTIMAFPPRPARQQPPRRPPTGRRGRAGPTRGRSRSWWRRRAS